jgi:hypothetical protein
VCEDETIALDSALARERAAKESLASTLRQEELLRKQVELTREQASRERGRADAGQSSVEEMITPANLSKELLKSVLDAAKFETGYDEEEDLVVNEQGGCFVLPGKNKDRIRLTTGYVLRQDVPHSAKLEAANKINTKHALLRASVGADDVLCIDYCIPLNDGITKRFFALTVKRFCASLGVAVQKYVMDLLR